MGGIRAGHAVQRRVNRSDAQHRGEIETVEQALVEVALADGWQPCWPEVLAR